MKFGQLIEYNIKNFFLKNHTQNVVESQTLLLKIKIENIYLDQRSGSL